MKWVKTSERLPEEEGCYYVKLKTDTGFEGKDIKEFWLGDDEEDKEEIKDNWLNTVEYWLDESKLLWFVKPEITDTDRMDHLNKYLDTDFISELEKFENNDNTKLREFVDNKINNM